MKKKQLFLFSLLLIMGFIIPTYVTAKLRFPLDQGVAQWIRDRFKEEGFTVIFHEVPMNQLDTIENTILYPYFAVSKKDETTVYIYYNEASSDASYIGASNPLVYLGRLILPKNSIADYYTYCNRDLMKAFALHELGHCKAGFPVINPFQALLLILFLAFLSALGVRKIINYFFYPQSKKGYLLRLVMIVGAAWALSEGIARVGVTLASNYFQKKEREADQYVIDYGDPELLRAIQKGFQYMHDCSIEGNFEIPGDSLDCILKTIKTHPSAQERAEYFKKALEKLEQEEQS